MSAFQVLILVIWKRVNPLPDNKPKKAELRPSFSLTERKTLWESGENAGHWPFLLFPHLFYNRLLFQHCQNLGLFGKGLTLHRLHTWLTVPFPN